MKQLIECVPNFSEGNDMNTISQITAAIESVEGVKLLNVDPGKATNRTVVTFVGEPAAVVEAAFRGIQKAAELIDMSRHTGAHPRMGATDVCPLIPVANITLEETAEWSKKLGQKVGSELSIPVYLYEAAQPNASRNNLAVIRSGEYEGFARKMEDPAWKPDFGPSVFNIKSGATVIGARDFLIAYNVNLNTKSVKRANSVAFDIREAGRVKRIGNPISGPIAKDENGEEIRIPGKLIGVKAIGWFIEEYKIAQVSINITRFRDTPLHKVFDECVASASERGVRVTGSELVGLVPLSAMLDAGKYFLNKQQLSSGISDEELIHIAVKSMGLDELGPFDPKKRIIEYCLEDSTANPLVHMNLMQFSADTASESPAPGGGSIAAYLGALGISLGTMVANLSSSKKGWEDQWESFSNVAEKGQQFRKQLLFMVDEDTRSFNKIMDAFQLPKGTPDEIAARKQAIQTATKYAIEVPFKVMELCVEAMEIIKAMAEKGNPASASDAGVGAMCARTAVSGAFLNVRINCGSYNDKSFVSDIIAKGTVIENKAMDLEKDTLAAVAANI
ncbi:MAG: glutamate formimidoyltransferase [Bacteroidetes bacterium]|nr:glutamate formimidoyltransferase [Bacteroidota bacterium]